MEKLFTVHRDRYRRLAVNPAYAVRGRFTWVLTDLKPAVLERAGAAQIYGPSLPPRHDLQDPCRLLPWPAEVREAAPFSRLRLAARYRGPSEILDRRALLT